MASSIDQFEPSGFSLYIVLINSLYIYLYRVIYIYSLYAVSISTSINSLGSFCAGIFNAGEILPMFFAKKDCVDYLHVLWEAFSNAEKIFACKKPPWLT